MRVAPHAVSEPVPGIAEPAVRATAAFGLARDVAPRAVSPDEFPAFLGRITAQRLTGLAVAAVEAGALRLGDEEQDALVTAHRQAMAGVIYLERALLRVAELFSRSGVDFRVLKGASIAHVFYPDPSWRSFGDVDVLVRTRDWRRALAAVEANGFRRALPEPRRGFDERFGKGADYKASDGFELDMHRTLVEGPYGLWLQPDALFERPATFTAGGMSLPRLPDEAVLLSVCLHAIAGGGPPRLLPLRDIAQVALCGRIDWARLDDWARAWRLRAVVRCAFETVHAQIGIDPPADARRMLERPSTPLDRRVLESYTKGESRGAPVVATLLAIPGVLNKADYVRALVVPDPAFLAARTGGNGSYRRRWRTAVRRVLKAAR